MHKTLLITGANGQLGTYLAEHYASAGYPLLLLYHKRMERLAKLQDTGDVVCLPVDLRDPEEVNSALRVGLSRLNAPLGYLIHTASLRSYDALPLHLSEELIWKDIFESNVYSAVNILKSCLPYMLAEQSGKIVLMGSSVTRTGLAQGTAYAAAKAAIVNLARSVVLENPCICANVISPGPIDTVLEEDYSGDYLVFRRRYFETYKKKAPTHSLISKAEIAALCDSLLSDQVKNLRGEEFFITGGIH